MSERPVRVLIACDRLGYEDGSIHGLGRLMIEWATAHDPGQVEVVACALRGVPRLREQLARDNVPIRFFGDGRFNPISIAKFVRMIRRERIDVLHLQDFGASTFGRIAGLLTRTPAIMQVHVDYDEVGGYPPYIQLFDRLLAPSTVQVLVEAQSIKPFCMRRMGFRADQVGLEHNPIPRHGFAQIDASELVRRREEYGLSAENLVVGATSRMYPVKGLDVLLEAFAQVLEALPEARLVLVGDGPEREGLEARARQLGIRERVIFTGFQQDVATHLRLFDVMATPSVCRESCPMSVLEGIAANLPVVASDAGGLPELVVDGETGFLVPPGEATPLAQALLRLLQNEALRSTLRAQIGRHAEQFTMPRHLARMEALYRRAAAGEPIAVGEGPAPAR